MNSSSEADPAPERIVRQQKAVTDLSRRALESDDLDQLLREATTAVTEALEAEYGSVFELVGAGDELLCRQRVGWREARVETATVPADDSGPGRALASAGPVIVDELSADARFFAPDERHADVTASGICARIGPVDDPWGVIEAQTCERRAFTDLDANFLQSVANVLAGAIDRRHPPFDGTDEYTEDILSAVDDMVYVVDETGNYRQWNESLTAVTGYSDAEVESMHPLEFIAEEDHDALTAGIAEIFETGHSRVEATVVTKDGERIPYEFSASRLETSDGDAALAGIGRDITVRKEHERALEESERRYRTLAENFPNGVVTLFDHDLEYTLAAGQAFEELAVSPDEVEGRTPREVWGSDAADIEPTLQAALEGEEATVELSYIGRDWIIYVVPVTDERGSVYAGMTMAQDITERKERERFLHDAKAQLEAATEAGAIGTWEWRIPEDRMIVGSSLARTFGVDPEEAREGVSLDRLISSIHENDRDRVVRRIEEAVETCGEYEEEYRVWNADGELRWVVARGHVECDESGNARTFPGALTDITDRREIEVAYRKSEQRYRTLFESIDEGFCIVELLFDEAEVPVDYRIIEANPAFEELTGLVDVQGKTTDELGTELEQDWYETYGQVARTGEPTRFVQHVADWDQWFDVYAFRIGEPAERKVAILFTDITEQKHSQQVLERLNDASRELMEADPSTISDQVASLTGAVLDVEYAALWRYDDVTGTLEEHVSRVDVAGSETVDLPEGVADRAWQTFVSSELTVDNEGDAPDSAGSGPPIRSCLIVPLGRHGVVCAGSTRPDAFDDRTIDLAETVATTVETAWNRAEGEQQLSKRNEELERLDRLNSLIREIDQVLVEADSLEAIDRAVCERLSASDYYEFAWIGERNPVTETVEPREWAGVDDGYVDALAIATDESPPDRDPVATAVQTQELQVVPDVATDSRAATWREATLNRGARSCIAVPLVYHDSLYGVLTVYTDHPQPDERDHAILAELGETIAHAIDAVHTKQTLLTDSVVELTLTVGDSDDVLAELAGAIDCEVEFDGLVPHGDDRDRLFFTTRQAPAAEVLAAGERLPGVAEIEQIREDETRCAFEATVTEPTLASHLLDNHTLIRSLTAGADATTVVVDLPDNSSVREFVERVRDVYPMAELAAHRTRDRPVTTSRDLRDVLDDRFTDRQREILEMAYLSGFFESPRERTGTELAEALGITQSTFSHHLRKAERRLCELVFENT